MTREVNCGCLFGQTCRACADVDPRKMPRRVEPVDRRATVAEGEPSLPPWMVPLWDSINEYATACGADTSKRVYGNTSRQTAVAKVDSIVRGVAAYDSTRLALLERLLREIVEADDALRGAVDEFDAVADERKMTSAIEAARAAIGGGK